MDNCRSVPKSTNQLFLYFSKIQSYRLELEHLLPRLGSGFSKSERITTTAETDAGKKTRRSMVCAEASGKLLFHQENLLSVDYCTI